MSFQNGNTMIQLKNIPAIFSQYTGQLAIPGLMLAISQAVQATPIPEAINFTHKDWDLTCDNTLTCRAAGYSADETDPAATVLITREAGASTPVINEVMLANYDSETDDPGTSGIPQLLIDNQSQGALLAANDDSWKMSDTQFAAFKQALKQDKPVSFKDSVHEYIFSGAGSSAVLLRMDDVQGRIGTPDALFRKGTNSETTVKPPVATPLIIKAPVQDIHGHDMSPQETALIKPRILATHNAAADCDEELLNETWQIARLNNKQSLITVPCWRAAYNSGDMYFVIDDEMKNPPVMVTDSATDYEDGILSFSMKGRGLGDCWSYQQWVWDGKQFIDSSSGNTGRCRLIRAGGAWDIPQRVTRVETR